VVVVVVVVVVVNLWQELQRVILCSLFGVRAPFHSV
jgi:hypothetical protein